MHLDGRNVSLRPITLPAGAAKRLGDILPGELENVLPFPVSEAVLHHPGEMRDHVVHVPPGRGGHRYRRHLVAHQRAHPLARRRVARAA